MRVELRLIAHAGGSIASGEIADPDGALLQLNAARALEDLLWDQMAPVGREFGSPDFDRLMQEDHPNTSGAFCTSLNDQQT